MKKLVAGDIVRAARRTMAFLLIGCLSVSWSSSLLAADSGVKAVLSGKHRDAVHRHRDGFRHPVETLQFMGLEPGMTTVEIWPGGGWYTEVLAPYLREKGTYYAAHFPAQTEIKYYAKSLSRFKAKLKAAPDVYDGVKLAAFYPPSVSEPVVKGQADMVLTFRNVHNWMKGGYDKQAFTQFYQMLKPGGVLGVVEHRARPGTALKQMIKSGYVTEAHVIALAQAAGFKLEAKSEVNANAKDTTKHPKGVWTLPPRLALGDKDREKYLAIGESDRMTLKFRKPSK